MWGGGTGAGGSLTAAAGRRQPACEALTEAPHWGPPRRAPTPRKADGSPPAHAPGPSRACGAPCGSGRSHPSQSPWPLLACSWPRRAPWACLGANADTLAPRNVDWQLLKDCIMPGGVHSSGTGRDTASGDESSARGAARAPTYHHRPGWGTAQQQHLRCAAPGVLAIIIMRTSMVNNNRPAMQRGRAARSLTDRTLRAACLASCGCISYVETYPGSCDGRGGCCELQKRQEEACGGAGRQTRRRYKIGAKYRDGKAQDMGTGYGPNWVNQSTQAVRWVSQNRTQRGHAKRMVRRQ